MAGRHALEEKIHALQALRDDPDSPATAAALRKALNDRNNYFVSKAAALIGELRLSSLAPDLVAAFPRFLDNPVKADTQCYAKTAIAKALKEFEYEVPDLYISGLQHVQMEPVFGGSEDTAITLRGTCAMALSTCRSLSDLAILRHLTGLLTDKALPVRRDAARAIAQLGRAEGALLLRLRVGCGDEPEVAGECFCSLLSLEERDAVPFVSGYLVDEFHDVAFEAAAALGQSNMPEAAQALIDRYPAVRTARFREALLLAVGATRHPDAVDFLIGLIRSRDIPTATLAVTALAPSLRRDEVLARVEQAVSTTSSAALASVLRRSIR